MRSQIVMVNGIYTPRHACFQPQSSSLLLTIFIIAFHVIAALGLGGKSLQVGATLIRFEPLSSPPPSRVP